MPSGPTSVQPPAKSPLFAAVGLSLAIGVGTVLGTADIATIADVLSGKWLTRGYTETQQAHTIAIAALEHSVGSVARDIDFVASRAGASIRRSEDQTSDRFAHLDAEIAALKEKLLGVELTQLISSRIDAPPGSPVTASEASGLRSSLIELSSAHHSSVAAITRRLDRIEVKVGLSTDVTSSIHGPGARKSARRTVKARRPRTLPPADDTAVSSPFQLEHGHLFTIKPPSRQRAPLRLTRLPD